MKWERKPPRHIGLWLRFNAGHRITRHDVVHRSKLGRTEGPLLLCDWGENRGSGYLSVFHPKLKGWLWFGPITISPDEEPLIHADGAYDAPTKKDCPA